MEDPETYKNSIVVKNTDIEDIYQKIDNFLDIKEINFINYILSLEELKQVKSYSQLNNLCRKYFKQFGIHSIKKSKILHYLRTKKVTNNLNEFLIKKPNKSQSGVLVVTVLTSPYININGKQKEFSCHWDCHYCPKEPHQPRSYLHDEPSVIRANTNNFDPVLQFTDRCVTLFLNGHPIDKIELLVLGGTWNSYPVEYRETFIRDIFYAANTFMQRNPRKKYSLEREKKLNETSKCRIIGITLETRPDCINRDEIHHLRKLGCTRVQLGVQHTDYTILKKINRKCYLLQVKNAIRLLKDACYKIDIHLMTQLPLATPELDKLMFETVLYDEDIQVDQWKIYPCEITPWTKIKKWYDEGKYKPYEEEHLMNLLMTIKNQVHPWIRLNRVVRDIPSQYISGGNQCPNLRQEIHARMKEKGLECSCIRCREISNIPKGYKSTTPTLVKRNYKSSDGDEIFISYETPDHKYIYGFLRLRLPNNKDKIFNSLNDMAMVRELHVYGNLHKTHEKNKGESIINTQHSGLGSKLLKEAESIAWSHYYKGIAIISGVGSRNYYRKNNYIFIEDGEYMCKDFYLSKQKLINLLVKILIFLIINFIINKTTLIKF